MSETSKKSRLKFKTYPADSTALTLLDLPNHAIKLVLKHLNIKDKKSVKLVSKSLEKKVLLLDPEMRKWRILSSEDSDFDFEIRLPIARGKHMQQDYFSKIQLFMFMAKFEYRSFDLCLLMESFVNQWKDNIVHLEVEISGINCYLLDPELKMPCLKSLHIKDSKYLPEVEL